MLMAWRCGSMIGLPRHAPVELQEGDDRAGEGDRADGDAERHFEQAGAVDVAGAADAESLRRIEGGGRDQHRGKADERVEEGHKLRHRRHRDAFGAYAPTPPPMPRPARIKQPRQAGGLQAMAQRRDHGDGHADHAVNVALHAASRMTKGRAAPG